MDKQPRQRETGQDREKYATPFLIEHGTIATLTQGTGGSVPDSANQGSTIPP